MIDFPALSDSPLSLPLSYERGGGPRMQHRADWEKGKKSCGSVISSDLDQQYVCTCFARTGEWEVVTHCTLI